jgi:hypothetical protein
MQASQSVHAALAFAHEHPVSGECYLVLLAARDVLDLSWLLADAIQSGWRAVAFYEPDLNNELTAVALEGAARGLCRKFHLLFGNSEGGETDDGNGDAAADPGTDLGA